MFYEPQCKPEVKVNPLEMGTLIAWLERQPAEKKYDYCCIHSCLAAQYYSAMGEKMCVVPLYGSQDPKHEGFRYKLEWLANHSPWTFGAALERARALA